MLRILFNLILIQNETMIKVSSFAIQSRTHELALRSLLEMKHLRSYPLKHVMFYVDYTSVKKRNRL